MGALTSRLLARLVRPDAIRAQVLAYLSIARVHNLVKSSYDRYLAAPSVFYGDISLAKKLQLNPQAHQISDPTYLSVTLSRSQKIQQARALSGPKKEHESRITSIVATPANAGHNLRPSSSSSRRASSEQRRGHTRPDGVDFKTTHKSYERQVCAKHQDNEEGQGEWEWHGGFPDLWLAVKLYDFASTVWMIWATIRTLLFEQLENLISPATQYLFGMPGNCFLPGRLAAPLAVSPLATVLLASYHLAWRLWQRLTQHNRLLSLVVFMLASERDLERFYATLETAPGRFMKSSGSSGCYSTGTRDVISGGRSHDFRVIKTGLGIGGAGAGAGAGAGGGAGKPCQQSIGQSGERLFLGTMCYQVQQGNRAHYYKLRFNRTREARTKLVRHIALTSVNAILAFGIIFVLFLLYIVIAELSDYRYAHVYRGCYPPLEKLRLQNQLDYFPSFRLNWHHALTAFIFDLVENTFLWGDSGLCLTFVPVFIYLLNYDLLLHWSGLEVKLERLLQRARYQYCVRDEHRRQQVASLYHCMALRVQASDRSQVKGGLVMLGSRHNSLGHLRGRLLANEEPRQLEVDINEFQFELCDFFRQIKQVNGLVGDSLTASTTIWLAGCTFVSYNQLLYDAGPVTLHVDLVLALGFFVITLATYHLLELRRRCLKSYRLLCSLMAYDQSRRKRAFIKVLEYYTSNITNYHILRTYAYKPTTFIAIIGWSFSCFFIAYTLLGPHTKGLSLGRDTKHV